VPKITWSRKETKKNNSRKIKFEFLYFCSTSTVLSTEQGNYIIFSFLVYADDVNILGGIVHTVKGCAGALVVVNE